MANDLYNTEKLAKIIMLPSGNLNDLVFINSLTDKSKFIEFLEENYVLDVAASEQFDCNIYLLA